jgi:cytochrome P450
VRNAVRSAEAVLNERAAAATRYASVDFLTDTTIVDDPYPYYRYLREEHGPVWIDPKWGVAMVTGHREAMAVYRDDDTYSSCNAPSGPFPGLPEPPEGDDASELIERHRAQMALYGYMVTWDPPQHAAYRSLLMGLFTPTRLAENEEFMWRLADEELDALPGRGACEFVGGFAEPFTFLVVANLLGVPDEDMGRFRDWFRSQKSIGELDEEALRQKLAEAQDPNILGFFESAFTEYIADRRRRPRRDILTHLAQVTFPDGSVPELSILANEAAFLFAAGQETTARTITFAVQHLAEHPDVQATLRADRTLIPAFIEEILRLESPIKDHFRMARRTTTLGGVTIPAGTTVMLMIGAINRDPDRFPEPDALRLDRPNLFDHVAFAKGAHSCLGQQLARTESRVSLHRILDRTTDLRISDAHHGALGERRFEYDPTSLFRGLRTLHLRFTESA